MAKIVHLTSVHTPFDTRIFHKECTTLAKAGFDVVLVVPHDRDETVNGVRIRSVPHPGNRLDRMLLTAWRVYQAALSEDAELYHFHDPELIPFGLLLRLRGKPVVYDIHEDYVTAVRQKPYLPPALRLLLAWMMGTAEKYLTGFFQLVLAEKYYAERFPQGKLVLNYPLVEDFSVKASRTSRNLRLLYTGVVSENRGALLHSQLVSLLDDIEVHVVGRCAASLADEMRQVAGRGADRLHIDGEGEHVPYQRILDYYQQGDWLAGLAIFPPTPHYQRKELTKLFEYMGARIPIICSDFAAWKDLVQSTQAGLCVDPLDPKAAVRAVRYLVEHPKEAETLAESGRYAFETRYNWDTEARKLTRLYESLLP